MRRTPVQRPAMIEPQEASPYPSTQAAFFRLLILKKVVGYAFAAPPRSMLQEMLQRWSEDDVKKFTESAIAQRENYWGPLEKLAQWEDLATPKERELAASTIVTMTGQEQTNALWRIEAIQVLLWSLGKLDALPPLDKRASMDLLKDVPNHPDPSYIATLRPRSREELEGARLLAELWHWRSRTRTLTENGTPVPDGLKAKGIQTFDDVVKMTADIAEEKGTVEVVDHDFAISGKPYRNLTADEWSQVRSATVERHFTLNWLCGYAPGHRWDETPTGT